MATQILDLPRNIIKCCCFSGSRLQRCWWFRAKVRYWHRPVTGRSSRCRFNPHYRMTTKELPVSTTAHLPRRRGRVWDGGRGGGRCREKRHYSVRLCSCPFKGRFHLVDEQMLWLRLGIGWRMLEVFSCCHLKKKALDSSNVACCASQPLRSIRSADVGQGLMGGRCRVKRHFSIRVGDVLLKYIYCSVQQRLG